MSQGNPSEEGEAARRFNETLGKLASMPPKPHDEMKKGREPKPAPKPSKP